LSEFDWFFEEISSGIKALVEKFIEMPYFFYSEQDMHAYLYHNLMSGKLGEFSVETISATRVYCCTRNTLRCEYILEEEEAEEGTLT